MFIDKNSIIINGVNMGTYLTSVIYGYNKLWSEDTGRSLSGRFNGVLKGIFPKLELNFRPLNQAEVELLVPILDSEMQTVTYYDPRKRQNISMQTYTGDYQLTMENIGKTKSFKVSFISIDKRS